MNTTPRITHITTHLGRGGATRNVLLSALGLARRGYRVSVYSGPTEVPEGDLIEDCIGAGVRFEELPSLAREIHPTRDLRCLSEITRSVRADSPDLVHTHQSKAGFLGRWALKRFPGIPAVHTPHGHVFYGYFSPRKTRLFESAERRASRWCDRLVALTPQEAQDHLDRDIGRPDQWVVIPSGVDLSGLSKYECEIARERFRIPPDALVLVSVGRLEPVKGFLDFLPYFAASAIPGVHWVIAGDGSQRIEIERRIEELGLAARVHLAGWVASSAEVLEGADGVLVPSRNEGMGRVVIEAYSMGLPVLAADAGGLPDLVTTPDHGALFSWASCDSIPSTLSQFISRLPELNAGVAIRRQTAVSYSAERMVDQLDRLYQSLLVRS